MAARKMIQLTMHTLDTEQHERLRALSQRTHVPMSHYIREGIDMVLDQHKLLRCPFCGGTLAATDNCVDREIT